MYNNKSKALDWATVPRELRRGGESSRIASSGYYLLPFSKFRIRYSFQGKIEWSKIASQWRAHEQGEIIGMHHNLLPFCGGDFFTHAGNLAEPSRGAVKSPFPKERRAQLLSLLCSMKWILFYLLMKFILIFIAKNSLVLSSFYVLNWKSSFFKIIFYI